MRLRTCIFLELFAGAALLGGLSSGASWALTQAQHWNDHLARFGLIEAPGSRPIRRARIARPAEPRVGVVKPVERDPQLEWPSPPLVHPVRRLIESGEFAGVPDELLLAPLREAAISRVRFNRGGSSISLRIDFENGARAAFKPEQTNRQSIPRYEIAAYRLDRLLGLGGVPPAIGRAFRASDLFAALDRETRGYEPRLRAEMIADANGWIAGELSWWIPAIKPMTLDGFEIDGSKGLTAWKRYLVGARAITADNRELLRQISVVLLFDFVINNPDRWSGANARGSEDGRMLYFMDNTLSFGTDEDGHPKSLYYLQRSRTYSRSFVERLRTLGEDEVRAALSFDLGPYDYLLSEGEIAALLKRRDYAIAYIDELIRARGEAVALAFP